MNPLGNGNGVPQTPMNPMASQIANAIQFARTFSSPEEYMKNLQQHNPQMYQKILEMQKSVQDPMGYANRVLAQQGINPAQIADILQRR